MFTRDAADKLGYKKPALLHAKFLPALQGANTKMSASNENSAIFMTDEPKKIAKKIKSHAFSGGGATQEDHQKNGGNPDVDVAYQYLSFFEDDDERMESLAREYRAGTLSTSQMKEACIATLQKVVSEFQQVCPFPLRVSRTQVEWVPKLTPPNSAAQRSRTKWSSRTRTPRARSTPRSRPDHEHRHFQRLYHVCMHSPYDLTFWTLPVFFCLSFTRYPCIHPNLIMPPDQASDQAVYSSSGCLIPSLIPAPCASQLCLPS